MSLFQRVLGNAVRLDLNVVRGRYPGLFTDNEVLELAYSLMRDVIVLTDQRYVEVDVIGVRGVKTRYLSIPYGAVSAFSVESAGDFDVDAELLIWARGVPGIDRQARRRGCSVARSLARGTDVFLIQQVLTYHIGGVSPAVPGDQGAS